MNHEHYLLASTYLDGELTADQRELAESDPDVMSEVDRLRDLQTRLRSVEPPSTEAREMAIGAAMAEFSALASRPAPPINAATTTVQFRRRPAYTRYLGIAAAVVAVAMLGFVVATGVRPGANDDTTSSDAALDVAADEPADEPASEAATEDFDRGLTESNEAFADDMADGDVTAEAAAPAAELEADAGSLADEPASEAADEPTEEPAAAASEPADDAELGTVPPDFEADLPLATPNDLGAYGAYLLGLTASDMLPPTPETSCTQQVILGSTQYVFDGLPIDVLIAVDDQLRTVTAVDPDTCESLVVGPLF
jgi:hypothetical protein